MSEVVQVEAIGSPHFAWDFLGKPPPVATREAYDIEGLRVRYRGGIEQRGLDAGSVMTFLIERAPDAAGTLFLRAIAQRIYKYGKSTLRRLRIDGRDVPVNEEDVLNVLRQGQSETNGA